MKVILKTLLGVDTWKNVSFHNVNFLVFIFQGQGRIWIPSLDCLQSTNLLRYNVLYNTVHQHFTIKHDISYGFVIYGLDYVEVGSLSAHFLESFYHKWMLNFIKSFLCISWDDHMVFVLQFVNALYHWLTWRYWKILPFLG